jgi:hypothetical protein
MNGFFTQFGYLYKYSREAGFMPEFLTLEVQSNVVDAAVSTLLHRRLTGYGPKSAEIGRPTCA